MKGAILMKKLITLFFCICLFACGQKAATESPYQTFAEWIDSYDDPDLVPYMIMNSTDVYGVAKKDGHYYQLSGKFTAEESQAFDALDFFDENYRNNVLDLLRNVKVDACLDFTDRLPSQSQLDAYKGKTMKDLVNDGYEETGWNFWEEGSDMFVEKDGFEYTVSVELPEGFDYEREFEYSELDDAKIVNMEFEEVSMSALPLK